VQDCAWGGIIVQERAREGAAPEPEPESSDWTTAPLPRRHAAEPHSEASHAPERFWKRTPVILVALVATLGIGIAVGSAIPRSSTGSSAATLAAPSSAAAGAVNLSGKLLVVTDLPAGWAVDSSTGNGSGGVASCKAINSGAWQTLPSSAEAQFTQGALGPFLDEKLAGGSRGQVDAAWQSFAKATADCSTFTGPDSSGGTDSFTLAGLSFPSYGDGTYALAVSVKSSAGLGASGDIVVVRKGTVLVEVILIGLAGVPVSTAEDVVSKAAGKA
jgi:hypothetical protein